MLCSHRRHVTPVGEQIENGTPYLLYKDAANAKSNQKNLGVISCRCAIPLVQVRYTLACAGALKASPSPLSPIHLSCVALSDVTKPSVMSMRTRMRGVGQHDGYHDAVGNMLGNIMR